MSTACECFEQWQLADGLATVAEGRMTQALTESAKGNRPAPSEFRLQNAKALRTRANARLDEAIQAYKNLERPTAARDHQPRDH